MSIIHAGQLFYSRVEAAYSPNRKSGYQIVYQTPDISGAEAREIEVRIKCFEADKTDVRYQFFRLSTGRVALAASQGIDDIDTTITDRTGRRGPFVAHCLVIGAGDFMQIDQDPFVVFETALDAFVFEPRAMIAIKEEAQDYRVLNLEPFNGNVSFEDFDFEVGEWTVDEFSKFWYHAADAARMVATKQSLYLLTSDSYETYELFRLLFRFLAPAQRLDCAFSTFVDGCVPMPGAYWAVAGTRRSGDPNFWRAQLDRRVVEYRGPTPPDEIKQLARQVFRGLRLSQGYDEE
jgi:hypothetical protein